MLIVKAKTRNILKNKNISFYKLSKLINYDESYLLNIFNGKNSFPEKFINKLLPILEVSKEEFESWVVADKYPKEILERAIQIRKDFPYKRKSILTVKIDKVLDEKNMSRTALAKQIKYSQSGLNKMIIGKINMSKSVMERVSKMLEIPQDEILSWIVADKYSLDVLERALD
jgi:transcriptional regulator with XRE-family HTH domain